MSRSAARVAPWLCLAAFAAALSLHQLRCFDYWWHLKSGEWIALQGEVPRVDPFTYTVPGARWVDIHWLHQLGLYGLYRLGGHAAVVVSQLALVWAWLAALAPIGARRERPLLSVVALALALALAADRIMPRPEWVSFVCLAGVLALFDRHERRGDAWVYAVVPIQLLWVNVHGLFAVGLAVCAIYLAAELLRPLVSPGAGLRPARLRRLAAVSALAAGSSLLNPNGLDGALYPLAQLGMIGPASQRGAFGSLIAELIPPLAPDGALPSPQLALFGLLAALSLGAMALHWRRLHAADPLLWVAFGYLALGAQRNVALFAGVGAVLLVRNLNAWLDAHAEEAQPRAPRRLARLAAPALCAALLLLAADAASGRFFERLGSLRLPGLRPMATLYPEGAVDWIARHRPPGPIHHHMADGGYILWRLFPDYRPMVDGRLEIFGEERFLELDAADPESFRALDARYRFGSVLLHYSLVASDELLYWLYFNSNWKLTFVDDTAALFVRVPERGVFPYAELDLDSPQLFPPLGAPGAEDRLRRLARTHFLSALHRYEAALALWRETVERYPELPQGDVILAALLHRNGLVAAAEAVTRRMLAERPDDPVLHIEVGDLRFEAGDLDGAREHYDAALALAPQLPYALYRRGALAERERDPHTAAQLYLRALARSAPADALARPLRERLQALGIARRQATGAQERRRKRRRYMAGGSSRRRAEGVVANCVPSGRASSPATCTHTGAGVETRSTT
jgi:tetratricopeptide (TPR) repeat protein